MNCWEYRIIRTFEGTSFEEDGFLSDELPEEITSYSYRPGVVYLEDGKITHVSPLDFASNIPDVAMEMQKFLDSLSRIPNDRLIVDEDTLEELPLVMAEGM